MSMIHPSIPFTHRALRLCAAFALALIAGTALAQASDDAPRERRVGGDYYIAGGTVTVSEAVAGDLFAGGGSIDIEAPIGGDSFTAGGRTRLAKDVGQSVYSAGGQLTVNGKVGRNLRAMGGQVELERGAEVGGNVSFIGGQLRLLGTVRGHVQAGGGRVYIDGPVKGDVTATSGQITLGPGARIDGKLRYGGGQLQRDPAAVVTGGEEQILSMRTERRGEAAEGAAGRVQDRMGRFDDWDDGHRGGIAAGFAAFWTVGLILLAAVLIAVMPEASRGVAARLRARPWQSLGLGFVILVCAPVAIVIALVTIVGIPLALLALTIYLALMPLAWMAAAIAGGDWALARWRPADAGATGWRIAAAAVVLIVLALLGLLPFVGGLIGFIVLLMGVGALVLQVVRPLPPAAA